MKNLTAFILFMALLTDLHADCGSEAINYWPASGEVPCDARFMIEGYASSQHIIEKLGTDYPVYLKFGSQKINLLVSEICIGQFELTQAILIPEKKLEAGKTYTLVIENLPDHMTPCSQWNPATRNTEVVNYTAVDKSDTKAPVWTQKPDEQNKTMVHYGCGPAVYVHFNFAVSDESPVLVKTTVTNKKSSISTTYYLNITQKTSLSIGHGMCSGEFNFLKDDGDDYYVTFDLMDICGNTTKWNYDPVHFTKPTVENTVDY